MNIIKDAYRTILRITHLDMGSDKTTSLAIWKIDHPITNQNTINSISLAVIELNLLSCSLVILLTAIMAVKAIPHIMIIGVIRSFIVISILIYDLCFVFKTAPLLKKQKE